MKTFKIAHPSSCHKKTEKYIIPIPIYAVEPEYSAISAKIARNVKLNGSIKSIVGQHICTYVAHIKYKFKHKCTVLRYEIIIMRI